MYLAVLPEGTIRYRRNYPGAFVLGVIRMSDMAKTSEPKYLRDIVIINLSGTLPTAIPQALRDKRFPTKVIQGFANLPNALKAFAEPIVICEVGSDEATAKSCIQELRARSESMHLPVIVVGEEAEQYERELDKLFPVATTLNLPYGVSEILAAVNYIARTCAERKKVTSSGRIVQLPPLDSGTLDGREGAAEIAADALTQGVTPTQPDLVFAHLEKLELLGKDLGGGTYSSGDISLEYLAENNMLPDDEAAREAIKTLAIDAGRWGRHHLARTSFMAQKIVGAMNPDKALQENLKASGFLYAWSFAGNNPALLQKPYLEEGTEAVRAELCSKIKDSAMSALSSLRLEQASQILMSTARMIGKELSSGEDDVSITASALVAADLSSRICYTGGSWNPRRAYALIHTLKRNEGQELHPAVMACTVKILAEGLAARIPITLIRKELRFNKEFMAGMRAEAKKPVGDGEKRIALSALEPGMKLSQPIRSLDGREILSPDLILDEDLIWRLWQLSAIRPLFSPIILNNQN